MARTGLAPALVVVLGLALVVLSAIALPSATERARPVVAAAAAIGAALVLIGVVWRERSRRRAE
jgi:hypothetical protein